MRTQSNDFEPNNITISIMKMKL